MRKTTIYQDRLGANVRKLTPRALLHLLFTDAQISIVAEAAWEAAGLASTVTPMRSTAELYFTTQILSLSEDMTQMGSVQWDVLLALAAVWMAVYFCISNGVKSTGKVVWVTVPLPCLLLFVLLIRGVTLEGCVLIDRYY